MEENIYVRSSNTNYERLINAKKQIESGLGTIHDLIEVDDND